MSETEEVPDALADEYERNEPISRMEMVERIKLLREVARQNRWARYERWVIILLMALNVYLHIAGGAYGPAHL